VAETTDLSNEAVVELVSSWIKERRPGAVVRFGEGEGRLLVADANDEESLRVAANKLRRQAGIEPSAEDVLQIKQLVATALDEADVVGIRGSDWFTDEHKIWVERIEQIFARRVAPGPCPAYVCHCLVSNQIRDALPSLLSSQRQISVVSSRDLEKVLAQTHDVDVRIYPIPSQYVMRNVDGDYEARLHDVPIWPTFWKGLRSEITVREEGEVFLVGAGILGKELCIRIRELGGIALDLGSCLDGLAGKVTRGRKRPPLYGPDAKREATENRRLARKAAPYLQSVGWIASYKTKSAIDAEGRPLPWYRYAAIDFLEERARPEHSVFEFGCGNSTLWWSERTQSVTSVEHHPDWARKIAAAAPDNVEILEVELEPDGRYCRTPLRLDRKFDVLIVDGRDRVNSALKSLPALAPHGVIIWDDSHRRRYRHGLSALQKKGFKRIRFTGLGPIGPEAGETSVLYRPDNCFEI
jgi:GT-D fold-like domain/Methyltransferase domain